MGFKFSLAGLLRVRESFEKSEEQKLALAIGKLNRLKAMLGAVREELTRAGDRLSHLLARGTTGAELHLLCFERIQLERRESALVESVSSAGAEVRDQQARLREAKRKRKVLDNLRQRQLTLFMLSEARKGQQRLDDAFLSRQRCDQSGKGVA